MIRQPILGLISISLVIAASFSLIALFDYHTFHTWVTFLAVTMIPTQILIAAVWKSEVPHFAARLQQPLKGVVLSALMIFAGLIVAPSILYGVGGGITPPTPFVVMFAIHSVVIFIWVAKIWQGWPATLVSRSKLVSGLLTLLLSYFLTYVTFRYFFNFSSMQTATFYQESIDPEGIFMAWPAMAFSLTTAALMLLLVLTWEFWPFPKLDKKWPLIGKQPVLGVAATVLVLLTSYGLYSFCVGTMQMDPVQFMVRVPVSLIFGIFIVQNMMQSSLFKNALQPTKGLLLTLVSGLIGLLMHILYLNIAPVIADIALTSGTPGYQLELWIASAQLSVTFPAIILFSSFFNFWPLQKVPDEQTVLSRSTTESSY